MTDRTPPSSPRAGRSTVSANPLAALRALGERLRRDDQQRREADRLRHQREAESKLERMGRKARRTVEKRLGRDVADSLGPWRRYSGDGVVAAIGQPDEPGALDYYEGDAPGQDGEIRYKAHGDELWYRPRMTNASALIRDRDHFARMIVRHSIYADI